MNVNKDPVVQDGFYKSYKGVCDWNAVLVKIFKDNESSKLLACRDIAIAMQMATQSNVHRLLGRCLETRYPVLVYKTPERGTLDDRIHCYREQSKAPLEWKDRLRIVGEVTHAVAYLHTAFRRPIIDRDLKPKNVFLDQDDSAVLSDFSLAISLPEGKKYVEDTPMGTAGYLAPEYVTSDEVAESGDGFAFGVLLLELLTEKPAIFTFD